MEDSDMRPARRLYPGPVAPKETRKSVHQAFEILRRGKWLILVIALLVYAAAALYTQTLPEPTYTATTLILVEAPTSSSSEEAWDYGYVDTRSAGDRNLNNQVLILQQSLAIAQETAERLLAMGKNPKTGQPLSFASVPADELALLLQSYYITVSALSERGEIVNDVISVTAINTNPDEAVLIANVYADVYVDQTQKESLQRIVASREFLSEQVDRRRQELRSWEEQLKEMGRAGVVGLDAETERTIAQMAQLEVQLDEARIERSMREATLASAERELEELHPKLVNRMASGVAKEIELNQQKISELELVIGEYESRHSGQQNASGTEELNELKRQVAVLNDRVRVLSDQYVSEMLSAGGIDPTSHANGYVAELNQKIVDERIAISGIDAKINALERRLDGYSRRLENIPQQSMHLAQVHRARQTAEEMYLRLTEKLEEATLAEESKVGFATVLRPAIYADEPIASQQNRILALGALLGLMLGLFAAFARHKLDERIYTPDDLKEKDYTLLTTIPDMKPIVKKEFGTRSSVHMAGFEVSPMLLSMLRPQTAASEAYRRLYLSIQFSRPDAVVQTILVTSPEAGAGKSTTAINLAATAAQAGRRTLIVDADLRRPTVHTYLGLLSSPGLSECLAEPGGRLQADQLSTGIENFYVLTAGSSVPDATRILSSVEMRELIRDLRAEFDVIIFDSSPVLLTTDAALISTQMDATVVVTSAGGTSADALKQTVEELRNVGGQVVGTILNRFDPSYMYGYKNTYGYRHKYYEDAAR